MPRSLGDARYGSRRELARRTLRQAISDGFAGAARVVRATRLPTRQDLLDFASHQLLVHVVSWSAGLIAVGLVRSLFEVRGVRNLWGLAGSGGRTLVSAADFRLILSLAGFGAGLAMMIFVRHFLLRWIAEVRSIRRERAQGRSATTVVGVVAAGVSPDDFEGIELDPEP